MTADTALGLLVVLLLLLLCAFFVAGEFALVAVDRTQVQNLADEGSRAAKGVVDALTELSLQLSGAQLGITVTTLLLGVYGERVLAGLMTPLLAEGIATVIALAIMTVAQMLVGELIPKNLTMSNPTRAALSVGNMLRQVNRVLRPLVRFFDGAANAIVRRFGIVPNEELVRVRTLQELELLIRSSAEKGVFDAEESSLLYRSISFGDKTAADALVPRTAIDALPRQAFVADLVQLAIDTGHSRFPLYHEDLDNIVGTVHVKDVYRVPFGKRNAAPLAPLMQSAYAVPETVSLATLLVSMRARGNPMAVVIDEYGGTAGIITLEDLVEEVVGDIEDEYDPRRRPPVAEQGAGVWVVDGMLHHDELEDTCGFELPEGEWDTLAGFLLSRFERIPKPGERVSVNGWTFEITEMDKRRVARVRVTAPPRRRAAPDAGPET